MSFKITPQAEKTIQSVAKELPKLQKKVGGKPQFRAINKRVLGKDLPKEYKEKNDWHPMEYYTCKDQEPVLVNHVINLRKCFEKDGYEGLTHYCDALADFCEANLLPPVPKFMFWRTLFSFIKRKLSFKTKKPTV